MTEVDQSVKDCQDLADKYISDPSHYQNAAKSAVVGGTLGAAGGAVAGAVVGGSVGRSVGAGAAAGAVVSLLQQLFSHGETNPSREKFVEQCLEAKGYKVYGWE